MQFTIFAGCKQLKYTKYSSIFECAVTIAQQIQSPAPNSELETSVTLDLGNHSHSPALLRTCVNISLWKYVIFFAQLYLYPLQYCWILPNYDELWFSQKLCLLLTLNLPNLFAMPIFYAIFLLKLRLVSLTSIQNCPFEIRTSFCLLLVKTLQK